MTEYTPIPGNPKAKPWGGLANAFPVLLIMAVLFLGTPSLDWAYVMPAEQILHLMSANFSKNRTLVITQSTHLLNLPDTNHNLDRIIEERLWLKAPAFFRLEPSGAPRMPEDGNPEEQAYRASGNMIFRPLLMASDKKKLMSRLGVDTNVVALTRLDGVIAYRLGDKDTGGPKLFIEKETFLPLLLYYGLWEGSTRKWVTVRFDDYNRVGKGWYPYDVTYLIDDVPTERYVILNLETGVSVDGPISEITFENIRPLRSPERPDGTKDDQRIEEVIRILKEKYQ